MSPEERAGKVLGHPHFRFPEELRDRIANAIREAVKAEREDCADVADYFAENSPSARSIAKIIRERDE